MPLVRSRISRNLTRLAAAVAAAVTLAVPGAAPAAAPPTILTAGIDAKDQLYVTWKLGAGTSYEYADFTTIPIRVAGLSDDNTDNFASFDGCLGDEHTGCERTTAYRGDFPSPRDRRYFVRVTSRRGERELTSATWVIDDAQPIRPGDAIPRGDIANRPAIGHPLATAPVPSGTSIRVLKAPTTLEGLLRHGVRVRVTSPVGYGLVARITHDGYKPVLRQPSYPTGGTRTLRIRLPAAQRAKLRRQSRATLRLAATAYLVDGSILDFAQRIVARR